MPIYVFNGRVLPERVNAGVNPPQKLSISIPEANLEFDLTISIYASQISVILETASESPDIPTLKNYVDSFVRMLFDAGGYLECRGYDLEITSVVEPNGQFSVFGVEEGALKRSRTDGTSINMADLWLLLTSGEKSRPLQRALGDLREAIRMPHDTGFFCFRAVESMRQLFVEVKDGNETETSWERMSSALRIEQSYIAVLERFGKPQRHGETPYMSGDNRFIAMNRTWQIVDRYIEFARTGFVPLSSADFETLNEQ